MKFRKFSKSMIVALCLAFAFATCFIATDALAKGGGGGGGGGGGRGGGGYSSSSRSYSPSYSSSPKTYSPSPSPGYSSSPKAATPAPSPGYSSSPKAATPAPKSYSSGPKAAVPAPATKPEPKGYSSSPKSATPAPAVTKPATPAPKAAPAPPKTALQQKMEKPMSKQESAKALSAYKDQQAKFKNPPPNVNTAGSSAAVNNIRQSTTYRPGSTYVERRTVFYHSYTPPVYMYSFAPRYGVWDAMFMFWMLDHASHHNTFYHQQNDPGFQAWRRDAEKQAETNAELKAKLAAMDEKVKQMERDGVKRDSSYVPEEAKSVALAEEVATKEIKKKDDGGFPWGWTILIVGGLAVGGYFFLRRRNS